MSRLFDGTDDKLTFGQALIVLAQHTQFRDQSHQREVEDAFRTEFGLELPEPDATINPLDPRDITLRNQDEEIARLRGVLAARERADAEVLAKAQEIANLRAAAGETPPTSVEARAEANGIHPRDAELAESTEA